MVNVPHVITLSLINNLLEDVAWAQVNAYGGKEERDLYKFNRVVVLSEVERDVKSGEWRYSEYSRNTPELKRVEEEFFMKRSLFEPVVFEEEGRDVGGQKIKGMYCLGGVSWEGFLEGVEEFGSMV